MMLLSSVMSHPRMYPGERRQGGRQWRYDVGESRLGKGMTICRLDGWWWCERKQVPTRT
jgi:hypothetical protein